MKFWLRLIAAAAAACQNIPTVESNQREASFGNLPSDMKVSFIHISALSGSMLRGLSCRTHALLFPDSVGGPEPRGNFSMSAAQL